MAEFISFQPSDFFNVVLYTGNATADRQITLGFQPDMAWAKSRTNTENHALFDSVRGGYRIMPDQDNAQDSNAGVTAWNSTGYVIGSSDSFNSNSQDFVNWAWKMGTTSGLSGGTITPSGYSISTTAGQSVIAYAGTGSAGTIPHGLGKTPDMIMVKETTNATNWAVYTTIVGKSNFLILNTDASEASTSNWNSTLPTSSLFSIGAGGQVNTSGRTYVAYCFANIPGYSKSGYFVGNSNSDGPFFYTGFRPAFILAKNTNSSTDWMILDDKRLGYNEANYRFKANTNVAEASDISGDIVSTGFKIRTTSSDWNTSGDYYNYLAFADFPLVSSNDIPTVAR